MRKVLLAAAIATSVLSAPAFAADTTATGAIKALDAAKCTITLADGKVYQFAAKCDFSKLKAGDKVVITYVTKGTENDASKVVPAA